MNTDQHNKLQALKAAAEIAGWEFHWWIYTEWERHNNEFFEGQLTPGFIQWGLTPHGHFYGFYSPLVNTITLHESLVDPVTNAWGHSAILSPIFASDVLLHEMAHQTIYQQHGTLGINLGTSSHNNPLWVAEINRLAPMLGLPANAAVVRQKRVEIGTKISKKTGEVIKNTKPRWIPDDGFMSLEQLSTWPHGIRPAGYYPVVR